MSDLRPTPEATPIPLSPRAGDSGGALLDGLDALRAGIDPIPVALDALRRACGARRAVWRAATGGPERLVVCEEGHRVRGGELPASLPGRWLDSVGEGELRLLGAEQLARDPRARAAGLREALVQRTALGTLWLDGPGRLTLDPSRQLPDLIALDHLEELSRRGADRERQAHLARLGEQAAGLAHDLRNQLSLISLEYRRLGAEVPRGAEGLDQALRGARRLCEDFLGGERGDARREVELRPLLEQEVLAAAKLSGRAGEVGVLLRCPRQLHTHGDAELLRRILRNLLLNAISASHSGGRVSVEARALDGGGFELIVADEGRGMDREDLDRMLRAGETRGGTGFGTSSVLDCVARAGGELEVESEPGAGTRAVVRCREAN